MSTDTDINEAIDFLKHLRPAGPWVLTAIEPDGALETKTAADLESARTFIAAHNGKRNIYYSVNPTRSALSSKAKKTDIAAIEYLLADLDPNDDETPDEAKARYLKAAENLKPDCTAIIDSGNGIQLLWKLSLKIPLDPKAPDYKKTIADAEARSKAVMLAMGSVAGTQNIDRILRVPGTTNLPTAAKLNKGRVACPTKLIKFNGATCTLNDFPSTFEKKGKNKSLKPSSELDVDTLDYLIKNGETGQHGGDRSKAVWHVVNELFRRGRYAPYIEQVILNKENHISEHIYDQPDPEAYAKRQVQQALQTISFTRSDDTQQIHETPSNIRVALLKLGITLSYDAFADRVLVSGLAGFGPALDDAGVTRIWVTMDDRFKFRPAMGLTQIILKDVAQLNSFHPVRDYLDGLTWDRVPRIDKWLTTYMGAADTPYTNAVGAITLVAAVRRVRQPGCKFDEMLILESPQGEMKSSTIQALAVRDDWFSDDLPLGAKTQVVIEQTQGRWLVEAAELSGMKKAEVEKLKAHLSRRIDRARMAFGRLGTEAPRQHVIIGTTNSNKYLLDTTGNRRYWPVRTGKVEFEKLIKDRDQLWAEAAAREKSGASIRLDPKLYGAAADQQAERSVDHPYYDLLSFWLGDREGKIAAKTIWEILDAKGGNLGQHHNINMGDAMRKLGWVRPNKASTIKIAGHNVSGYVKGEQPWTLISAEWVTDKELGTRSLVITTQSDDEPAAPFTQIGLVIETNEKEFKVKLDDGQELWLPNFIEKTPTDDGKVRITTTLRLAKKFGLAL